jgi:hypothetical protein
MQAIDVVKLSWVAKIPWERRHPLAFARMRFGGGVILLLLTAILYGYDRAQWWTPLLGAAGLMDLWGAYWIPRAVAERKAAMQSRQMA